MKRLCTIAVYAYFSASVVGHLIDYFIRRKPKLRRKKKYVVT